MKGSTGSEYWVSLWSRWGLKDKSSGMCARSSDLISPCFKAALLPDTIFKVLERNGGRGQIYVTDVLRIELLASHRYSVFLKTEVFYLFKKLRGSGCPIWKDLQNIQFERYRSRWNLSVLLDFPVQQLEGCSWSSSRLGYYGVSSLLLIVLATSNEKSDEWNRNDKSVSGAAILTWCWSVDYQRFIQFLTACRS